MCLNRLVQNYLEKQSNQLLKKGVKKALTTAATKTREHVGKKAGDKIVQMLSKGGIAPPRKPPVKKVTFKTTPKKITQQEINQRVNAILSRGKII